MRRRNRRPTGEGRVERWVAVLRRARRGLAGPGGRALALSALLVLSVLSVGGAGPVGVAVAHAPTCSSVTYDGSGTDADPFQVGTVDQLQCIGTDHGDATSQSDALGSHYELVGDIDASGTAIWNAGDGFAPIGSAGSPFTGTLDGNGHAITGLTVDRPDSDGVGLIGTLGTSATIRSISVANAAVTGRNQTGGLVGNTTGGTIVAAAADGTVTGNNDVGGLVGRNVGTVRRSNATATVDGSGGSIGGLAGATIGGTVTESYATGDVGSGGTTSVGGLVGLLNEGTVNESYATGNATGDTDVGGLVGDVRTDGNADSVIARTYAAGNVTNRTDTDNVGGLVGGMAGTSSSITANLTDSYWDEVSTGRTQAVGYRIRYSTVVENTQGFATADGQGRAAEMIGSGAEGNMGALDFSTTWVATESSYPILRNNTQAGRTPATGGSEGGDDNDGGDGGDPPGSATFEDGRARAEFRGQSAVRSVEVVSPGTTGRLEVRRLGSTLDGVPDPEVPPVVSLDITASDPAEGTATVRVTLSGEMLDRQVVPAEEMTLYHYRDDVGEWERLDVTVTDVEEGARLETETDRFSIFAVGEDTGSDTPNGTATATATATPAATTTETPGPATTAPETVTATPTTAPETATATPTAGPATGERTTTEGSGPGLGVASALIAALTGALLALRRPRG